jgi:hypothetical protein
MMDSGAVVDSRPEFPEQVRLKANLLFLMKPFENTTLKTITSLGFFGAGGAASLKARPGFRRLSGSQLSN